MSVPPVSAVDSLLDLLLAFKDADDADQAWGDFGDEEAGKLIGVFTESDWIILFDRRHELEEGSLNFLPFVLSDARHPYADRMFVWLVLTLKGWGWIYAADQLGARLSGGSPMSQVDAFILTTNEAVKFIEARLLSWLNFPYEGFSEFEDYVNSYSHLLSSGAQAVYTYVKRSPNTSLERTREI